ncbi:hypothetical protein [Euzebya tangerina]|uniref:hypothetical protein n=1 Tax=Euzebya tangerina TaxID=591198 RepID=UPI0013C363F6|nr:hypothetical protein [Euzebya tangerina]
MFRRVVAAGTGGLVVAGLVSAGLAMLQPPATLVTALALLAVIVPLSAAAGTVAGLTLAGLAGRATAARLAALGAPILAILLLFTVDLVVVSPDSTGTQIASFVLGSGSAAALAARFSDGTGS